MIRAMIAHRTKSIGRAAHVPRLTTSVYHQFFRSPVTTDLFKRQAEDPTFTRAQALQQAMLQLIDGPGRTDSNGRTLFSYAHPIFWAPFTLVGDGG